MKLRLVCRHWKRLVDGNSTLMERAAIMLPKRVELDRDFHPERLPPTASLRIAASKIFWVNSWWPQAGRKLVHLKLSHCTVSSLTLYGMLGQTPQLKSLHLNSVEISINSKVMPNVRLDACEELSIDQDHHCDFILKLDCPRLKRFEADVKRENVKTFLARVSDTLEELTTSLPAEVMLGVLEQLKHLTLLKIGTTDQYFANIFARLGLQLINLKILNLTLLYSCAWSSSHSLSLLNLRSFLKLETLCVRGTGTRMMPMYFNELAHRSLKSIRLINVDLAEAGLEQYISRSDSIRSMTFQDCAFSSWPQMFTAIGVHCQSLQHLDVTNCASRSYESCSSVVDYFDELRYLKLWNATLPTNALKMLFRVCPNVEQLHLEGAESIDDDALSTLRQKMKRLKWLFLWGVRISSEKQRHIAESFSQQRVIINGSAIL
uniref:F-box/LRR-repeat protein 20 n=1 Tax=Culex pipiens TaxID=7175 RepID=A0A8D8L949_CULPI